MKKPKVRHYKSGDPKALDSLRFKLISLIESTGGRIKTIAETMGVARLSVYNWIRLLDLVDHLDAVRTKNRKPKKPLLIAWYIRHDREEGRRMLMDVIWRNDGIIEACAIEMRCSLKATYNRIDKLDLRVYLDQVRAASSTKRKVGKPEPLRHTVDPHPHLVPIDGGG